MAREKRSFTASKQGGPEADILVKALGSKTAQNTRKIKSVSLLGSDEKVSWIQSKDNLLIGRPTVVPSREAVVYKVVF